MASFQATGDNPISKEAAVRYFSILVSLLLYICSPVSSLSQEKMIKIEYFGHACFQLTSPENVKILIDPFSKDLGYDIPDVRPTAVLVSCKDPNHDNVAMAKGEPVILRGVTEDGSDWNKIQYTYKDVKVFNVPTYRDEQRGAIRGKNSLFIIVIGSIRLGHMGAMGESIKPNHIRQYERIDVAFIPVGGHTLIDAAQADEIIQFINPKVVIPMAYKTPRTQNSVFDRVTRFTGDKKNVVELTTNRLDIMADRFPMMQQVFVMPYY